MKSGPAFGYFPNAAKTWLLVKPEKQQEANSIFGDTGIQITSDRRQYLGAGLGSNEYEAKLMAQKITNGQRG